MTSTALKKICLCFILFAFCLILCGAFDSILSPEKANGTFIETSRENEAGTNTTNSKTSQSNLNNDPTESILGFMNKDGLSVSELSSRYFDLSLEEGVPEAFAIECLDPNAFESSYSSKSTQGLLYDGTIEDAEQHCKELLAQKGWNMLEGSNQFASNFFKPNGTYQWLVLQYCSVGDKTMVVASTIKPS